MDGAHQFQSSVDRTMPIRLLHYAACFYSELLKQKTLTPGQSLPPVFPVVVYNGSRRWTAPQDVYEMVQPEPPAFLQVYQPHLRYYLIDEGRYTEAQLEQRHSPLSGVFGVENAGASWEALQQAVDRMVAIIQEDPHKERIDRIVTRWLKRHLHRLGAAVNLISSTVWWRIKRCWLRIWKIWSRRSAWRVARKAVRKAVRKLSVKLLAT